MKKNYLKKVTLTSATTLSLLLTTGIVMAEDETNSPSSETITSTQNTTEESTDSSETSSSVEETENYIPGQGKLENIGFQIHPDGLSVDFHLTVTNLPENKLKGANSVFATVLRNQKTNGDYIGSSNPYITGNFMDLAVTLRSSKEELPVVEFSLYFGDSFEQKSETKNFKAVISEKGIIRYIADASGIIIATRPGENTIQTLAEFDTSENSSSTEKSSSPEKSSSSENSSSTQSKSSSQSSSQNKSESEDKLTSSTSSSSSSSKETKTASSSPTQSNSSKQPTATTSKIPSKLVGTWTQNGDTIIIHADGSGTHKSSNATSDFIISEVLDHGNGNYEIVDQKEAMKFYRPGTWGIEGMRKVLLGFNLTGDTLKPTMWVADGPGQDAPIDFENSYKEESTYTRQQNQSETTESQSQVEDKKQENTTNNTSSETPETSENSQTSTQMTPQKTKKRTGITRFLPNTGQEAAAYIGVIGLAILGLAYFLIRTKPKDK
ncbi:LPXTG cell wall anchor domain-containing protein [Streptococcus sp. NLN64]|uniref:LPXTG cell wall anchor domain-containing protein n=1 Tax=Streptococcus sp. NLN64 TaxID=2822799 RepID=UPI0018CBBEEF|nr:LPXTG cell wall anchor domain-containing protein [Streptococcus sp. NLN64]MBG9367274.1 LPXTG cell wall anchor domain-containing protein [Streptococcus sp. NLN64]